MKVRDYTPLQSTSAADQVLQRELRPATTGTAQEQGCRRTQAKQQIDSFKVAGIKIETERLRQLYADDDGVA